MFKTMKQSRLAMIVCVLVLALVMTTVLALGVFADDATDKIDSYNVSIGDGLNILVNGTTATASSKLTIKYQFEGCEQVSIETTSSASNAYSVSIPVGPGQIDKTCTIEMYVGEELKGEPKTISVMGYCVNMINDYFGVEDIEGVEVSDELAQVCIDILLFGQESLKYLNLDTSVIDAKLEELGIDSAMATPYDTPKVYMENGAEMTEVPEGGTKITKVSLKVTDRYHLVFKDADGNEIVTQTVNIPSISKPYTVVGTKLVDEENNTYEDYTNKVTYSVTTYIAGMADDPGAGALVKQLYSLALAIDAYQGHQYKLVAQSSCSTSGKQVCDLCGQEVNAPLDPNNHLITSTVTNGVLHNKCTETGCTYEWISAANYWVNDGTSTKNLAGNGTTKFDTAQTTGLPALKDGKLAWVRSENATVDQYQTWIQTGANFAAKPESWSAFFSIDLTSPSATLPDGMDSVNGVDRGTGFGFRLLVNNAAIVGSDRWANAVSGNLLNITADGTMTGFFGLPLGTFDGDMTFAVNMTSDKDGLYVTYYIDNVCKGTVKCAHPVEGYYAYNHIYQTGYTSIAGTGMCMDNIVFASTDSNKAITDVDFDYECGSIKYTLGGKDAWVDNHNWAVGEITKQPTCLETGVESKECSDCGETVDGGTVPALPHKLANGKYENGTITYTCAAGCGKTFTISGATKLYDYESTGTTTGTPNQPGYTMTVTNNGDDNDYASYITDEGTTSSTGNSNFNGSMTGLDSYTGVVIFDFDIKAGPNGLGGKTAFAVKAKAGWTISGNEILHVLEDGSITSGSTNAILAPTGTVNGDSFTHVTIAVDITTGNITYYINGVVAKTIEGTQFDEAFTYVNVIIPKVPGAGVCFDNFSTSTGTVTTTIGQ